MAAIAGMELMEARLCVLPDPPVSATCDVEELRRIKTPDEIECFKQAAALADRGYQYFADTASKSAWRSMNWSPKWKASSNPTALRTTSC